MLSKSDARKLVRERLAALAPGFIAEASARICEKIARLPEWREAKTVALFAALPGEPDLAALWLRAEGKTVCYPRAARRAVGAVGRLCQTPGEDIGRATQPSDTDGLQQKADGPLHATEPALEFYSVASIGDLVHGAWKVREPQADPARRILEPDIDLICVPGLAFTADGHRLGRGRGYYDRFLAHGEFRARKVGVCFATQVLAAFEMLPHDHPVDLLVTEAG
jgi:5-formyltetrahydrofolate cyclo-ligase